MIYKVFVEYATGGEPMYEWKCDCEEHQTSATLCRHIIELLRSQKEGEEINEKILGKD